MNKFKELVKVVICLKSLTFVVSVTTEGILNNDITSCDLLEKSYLCGISNNALGVNSKPRAVVICLKSLTFVVSVTTHILLSRSKISCDLLEKSYLCGISNN